MKFFAPIAASLLLAAPVSAQEAVDPAQRLSLDQRMLLRCSAAFAMVAAGQQQGEEAAQAFPPLGERGREFFVRSSAQVMDESGLSREQLSAALLAEAQDMRDNRTLAAVMPVCLRFLDQMGPQSHGGL